MIFPQAPLLLSLGFGLTTLLSLLLFLWAVAPSLRSAQTRLLLLGLLALLGLQAVMSLNGFFLNRLDAMPPRFLLLVGPPLLMIISLFSTSAGRNWLDRLPPLRLTYLHVVRIPVELVLYGLFLSALIPELMTFAGRNFDILAGITAPLVAFWGIQQKRMGKSALLVWNFVTLGLVLFIVGNAVLSAPFPFQQFAFDQPNVGVLYFPFTWLPGFVVPLVLFSHLVCIRQLLRQA